jgi:hypothetical protein
MYFIPIFITTWIYELLGSLSLKMKYYYLWYLNLLSRNSPAAAMEKAVDNSSWYKPLMRFHCCRL